MPQSHQAALQLCLLLPQVTSLQSALLSTMPVLALPPPLPPSSSQLPLLVMLRG